MEKTERPEPSYIRKIDRPKLTYSVPEAAEILGVSKSKMYELVKIQGFPTLKIGGRLLVSVKGLERWIEEKAAEGWSL